MMRLHVCSILYSGDKQKFPFKNKKEKKMGGEEKEREKVERELEIVGK